MMILQPVSLTSTAAVILSPWMEHLTRIGKHMMNSFRLPHNTHLFGLLIILASFGGCTHTPATDMVQTPDLTSTDHYQVLIREARAEASMLRSELASIKIAMAKQNAELQSSKGAKIALRQREEELASEIQQVKLNVLNMESERDRLRRENSELQARASSVPELRQLVLDIRALQTSVQQMVNSMQTLSTDITKIKQDMLRNKKRLRNPSPKLTSLPPGSTSGSQGRNGLVIVSPGDTLWRISRAHRITVEQLKKMNGLTNNDILVGQKLKVPVSKSSAPKKVSRPDTQVSLEKGKIHGKSKGVKASEGFYHYP